MLILAQLDISDADMVLFEEYEDQALRLLANHGAKIIERLRSIDGREEVHLLHFPSSGALDAFRSDPDRALFQNLWLECGASSRLIEVERLEIT